MAYRPDYSDSDEFSDDYLYDDFEEDAYNKFHPPPPPRELTEAEKLEQQIKNLSWALTNRDKEKVIEHIEGLDINVKILDNWTPLLLSASCGDPELVEELLKRGADVNSSRDNCTALMMACNCPKETSPFEKSLIIIKLLVEKGANVKAINRKRMTALMFAASKGNLEAVKYLIPLSDKNAEDNQRWNALFWAVESNAKDVVNFLLEEGLEFKTIDVRNNTAIDLAKAKDFTDIIQLFCEEEDYDNILDSIPNEYEEVCSLKPRQKPNFTLDIYKILCGVRCESMVKSIIDQNMNLCDFLSLSHYDLNNLGITMSYQHELLLGGLYRFHKYPFHHRSLYNVQETDDYNNLDVSIQLMSAIKQIIAMQAAMKYLLKNSQDLNLQEEKEEMLTNFQQLKSNVKRCQNVIKKLKERVKEWDRCITSSDIINSNLRKYRMPWRKLVFSLSLITIVALYKINKRL